MESNNVALALYRPGTDAVELRRAMLTMPAVVGALDNIEQAIFAATTDRPFAQYGDAELTKEFAGVLKWIAKDIGIRNTESDDWRVNVMRVASIAKRYYPTFTINDVRMAFELLVTGDLDDKLPKDKAGNPDKEHYQMFNADYFCRIMNAYKGCRSSVIFKAKQALPDMDDREKARRVAKADEYSRWQTQFAFLHYKYRGCMPRMNAAADIVIYSLLTKAGLAEPIAVTEAEQRYALQAAIADFGRKGMNAEKRELQRDGIKADSIQHPAFMMARRRAIEETFDWMIKEELQITDYVK